MGVDTSGYDQYFNRLTIESDIDILIAGWRLRRLQERGLSMWQSLNKNGKLIHSKLHTSNIDNPILYL